MNLLEKYLRKNLFDPTRAMNALMASGLISDNCVWPADVADVDCARAIDWLELQPRKNLIYQ